MIAINDIIGICGLDVHRPSPGVWEVWMVAEVKVGAKTEIFEFTVNNHELFLSEESRDKGRRKRDLILFAMQCGDPIWVQLDPKNTSRTGKLYARRDFGWTMGPKRFKVQAKRKR
jgi:hypothetical protein